MIWFILFVLLFITMAIYVPANKIKRLWSAGVLGMIILYVIDSTLIWLGAFSYSYPYLTGLPIFYLLSAFPTSVLLCNYCPQKEILRLYYILIVSAILLILEYIVNGLGYLQYIRWNLFRSYMINITLFSTILWLSQCLYIFDISDNHQDKSKGSFSKY